MKKLLWAAFAVLLFANTAWAQSGNSNIGTEFWTGWMSHINGATGNAASQMNLYIACDVATTVTIASADGTSFNTTVSVAPNVITKFPVPASAYLGVINGLQMKGIHITSKNPIAVYAHIYASSVSGATLLLPVNTLSNDYYSLNYTQLSNASPSYSIFNVIGTEDNTTVQITPSAKLIDNSAANVPFTITLNKGQVYQGISTIDLTGTKITSITNGGTSCKKIAVFSGSNKIYIGKPNQTSDNLFQQVYPTSSWGKNYITVPLSSRNYDIIRIVLSDPTAQVMLNGTLIASNKYTNGFYYDFNSQVTNVISSDKPIQVIQYAVTQGNGITGVGTIAGDVGDPEMIYLNPLEQTIDHVILYSATEYLITKSFINVVLPTAAVSSFLLDGATTTGFAPVSGNTTYSYKQFSVTSGTTHTISASQGFNAIAYGFGNAESYGYAAGTNVKNLNEYVQYANPTTNAVATSGCTGTALDPEVILPYQTTSITWDLGNGTAPVTQTNPTYKSAPTKNGVQLYLYDYGTPVAYTAGAYSIKITVFNPNSTLCGSNEEVDLNFNVADPPQAKFSSRDTTCVTDTIGFKDLSTGNGSAIQAWHWDFGNGDTSIVQNPVYKYLTLGDYTVGLTVTVPSGCQSLYTKKVHIRAASVAAFTNSVPDCQTVGVTFTDTSNPGEGKIIKWIWNYGDTIAVDNRTDNLPFTHTYAKTGAYVVTLQILTDKSCFSTTVSKTITVYTQPVANFVLPDVCISDGAATFVAVPDTSVVTYAWNFGDFVSNVSASNPNTATGLTVTHKYNTVGIYNAVLTVTTANGCVAQIVKPFRVNGSSPQAKFDVNNASSLCSSNEVDFVNQAATPGFGDNVTSVDMYYDYVNSPTVKVHYERPTFGQLFRYVYPLENQNSKQYTVHMVAYSGQTCFNTYDLAITVLPVPLTTFNALPDICEDAGIINLLNYTTISGTAGTPQFYMDGSTNIAGGMLNAATAGIGTHKITFICTSNTSSCADTLYQNITIAPIPTVSAGQDQEVIAGASVTLHGTATGAGNIKYSWSPGISLSDSTILMPIATPKADTHYKLTITLTTGGISCPVTDSVWVRILHLPVVPNTFTPNGDGFNDTWEIKYLDKYPNSTIKVFNRAGDLVYSQTGYAIPWDGTYKNTPLPVGTYYYIIDPSHNLTIMTGSVNLIR